jgi:hypothetical protein
MNCQKCNQPMKEYHGLFEKGWDCTNENCGKIAPFPDIDFSDHRSGPKGPLVVDVDERAYSDMIDALNYAFGTPPNSDPDVM